MNNLIVGIYTLRKDRGQPNSFYTSMKKTNDGSLSGVQQPFFSFEDPISQSGAKNHHLFSLFPTAPRGRWHPARHEEID